MCLGRKKKLRTHWIICYSGGIVHFLPSLKQTWESRFCIRKRYMFLLILWDDFSCLHLLLKCFESVFYSGFNGGSRRAQSCGIKTFSNSPISFFFYSVWFTLFDQRLPFHLFFMEGENLHENVFICAAILSNFNGKWKKNKTNTKYHRNRLMW